MEVLPPRPVTSRRGVDRARQWLTWFGPARLAVGACSVLVVGVGAWMLLRPVEAPVEASLPVASATTEPLSTQAAAGGPLAAPTTTVPLVAVVHVAGAVVAPGVYSLPAASRVVDAVAAAGGLTGEADGGAVNLAAPVHDGERVYVPRAGESVPVVVAGAGPVTVGEGAPTGAAGPVDLNTSTVGELETLPGVGPSTAAAIVEHRRVNGPFATVDDLADVRGIGPAKLAALRPLVTV